MTIIFTLEAVLKIISGGFLFNSKQSYLRSVWNILDFTIVVSAILNLALQTKLSFIKALRVLRILRPLRLITRLEGLRIAVISLFRALPRIFQLQVVVLFFMYIAAVLMTIFLSGKLYYCELSHTTLSEWQKLELIRDKWDCLNYGGSWEKDRTPNFDNTLSSMMTIFILQSNENLLSSMQKSVDAVGIDM